MRRVIWPFALLLVSALGMAQAQSGPVSDSVEAIRKEIGTLRSLDDATRAVTTRDLARRIGTLAHGPERLSLARSLSYISTEGDFGRDTLQAIADMLVDSIKGAKPLLSDPSALGPAYDFAAQLAKYEGVPIRLDDAAYAAARAKLDEIDGKRAAADFTLTDLSGKSWTLSALKGKVVVVNFWATWCPPCRKEMPDLEELSKEFKDDGLVILAISDEEEAKVRPFIAEHKYTFPVLLDTGRKVGERYFVDGIPKNFIFDRDGKLVAQSMDMRTRRQFLELLAKAGLKPKG